MTLERDALLTFLGAGALWLLAASVLGDGLGAAATFGALVLVVVGSVVLAHHSRKPGKVLAVLWAVAVVLALALVAPSVSGVGDALLAVVTSVVYATVALVLWVGLGYMVLRFVRTA